MPYANSLASEAQEWLIKLFLMGFLLALLMFVSLQPADPRAYSSEPLSFTHNLFICTFDDLVERE